MFDHSSIEQASDVLKNGGVLVHPTSTVYGIACLPDDGKACNRIREIKGNASDKPLLLITDSFERVADWIAISSPVESQLMSIDSPDLKLTILFDSSRNCPSGPRGSSNQIGIRKTSHKLSRSLIGSADSALVSTSANVEGHPAVSEHELLNDAVTNSVDLVIHDDQALSGIASTLVRVIDHKLQLLRSDESSTKILIDIFGMENIVTLET